MSRLAVTTDIDWFTEMVVGGQRTVNQLVAEQLDPILRRGHDGGLTRPDRLPARHGLPRAGQNMRRNVADPGRGPLRDHTRARGPTSTMSTHPDNTHFFSPKLDPTGLDDELSAEVA